MPFYGPCVGLGLTGPLLAVALPITGQSAALRSGQLLDINVRTPKNGALGSVLDLVMAWKAGKVAYLIIPRGRLFVFGPPA
jgi:hypothetical protein